MNCSVNNYLELRANIIAKKEESFEKEADGKKRLKKYIKRYVNKKYVPKKKKEETPGELLWDLCKKCESRLEKKKPKHTKKRKKCWANLNCYKKKRKKRR